MAIKKSKVNARKKTNTKPKSVKQKKVVKPVVKKRKPAAKVVAKPVVRKRKLTKRVVAKPIARRKAARVVARSAAKTVTAVAVVPPSLPVSIQMVRPKPLVKPLVRPKTKVKVKPSYTPLTSEERRLLRTAPPQFTYMKAPVAEHEFQVGDTVDVFCDHEKGGERIRGWIRGIVVQVDNKLVAVQFRSNVFLTDGWMVPDRILWYPLTSDQIRDASSARKGSRKELPDY